MKDWATIKERFLRDPLQTRLGGIAANLARIGSFSDNDGHQRVLLDLAIESEYFIEWTAKDAALVAQEDLVRLQVQLARWQLLVRRNWGDREARDEMSVAAKRSSHHVLEMSGLLAAR